MTPLSRHSLTVAHIAGVPVRVHWSWPPITLAVAAALAQVYARDPAVPNPWGAAVLAAALLSLSLLLHELAHAVAARRLGLHVHGIAVLALGGVTEIADERPAPGRDLLVALAGPAASLALALAATLAWWRGLAPAVAAHLALANWALTVFNLLPAHPLDGGRALKATLWFLGGDELRASRAAALAARSSGWILVGMGVALALVDGDALNAAWVVVVGMFLSINAMDGYRRLVLQRALRGVTAADLMRRAFRAVTPDMPLDEFAGQHVLGAADQGIPVVAHADGAAPQRLLGMMWLRDLRRHTLARWPSTAVGQAMTPASRLRALSPDTPAGDALRALLETGEDLLPVVDGEVLSGVLRRSDVVSFIQGKLGKQ